MVDAPAPIEMRNTFPTPSCHPKPILSNGGWPRSRGVRDLGINRYFSRLGTTGVNPYLDMCSPLTSRTPRDVGHPAVDGSPRSHFSKLVTGPIIQVVHRRSAYRFARPPALGIVNIGSRSAIHFDDPVLRVVGVGMQPVVHHIAGRVIG